MNTAFRGGCKTLLFVCVCSSVCAAFFAMKCPPCEKIHCNPRKASKLMCKGGVTTGVCGCCPVCARIKGERCGGYYNFLGKCDKGLYCEPMLHSKVTRKRRDPEGRCKKGKRTLFCLLRHVKWPPSLTFRSGHSTDWATVTRQSRCFLFPLDLKA